MSTDSIEIVQPGTLFNMENAAKESFLAKRLLNALGKAYPHMKWRVEVDARGGMVILSSPDLSGKMGVMIKITSLDNEDKVIIRYAGELLERYNIVREKALGLKGYGAGDIKRNIMGEAMCDKG